MKTFTAFLAFTLMVLHLAAQAQPTPAAPPSFPTAPADGEEARKQIEEFVRSRQQTTGAVPAAPGAAATKSFPNQPAAPATGNAPAGINMQVQPGGAVVPTLPVPGANVPGGLPAAGATEGGEPLPGNAQNEPYVTDALRLESATLEQLLDVYGDLVGRVILKPATLPPLQNISIKITDVELTKKEAIQALDTYLSLNQITTLPMGEKFLLVLPNAEAFQNGPAPSDADTSNLPEAAQYTSKVVQLKYVKPTEVVPVLEPIMKSPQSMIAIDSTQTLLLRDYAINVKRALELIEKIDIAVPVEYETELIPIKYALASDIAQVLGGLTTGGSVTSVGANSSTGLGGGGGFGGGNFGGGGANFGGSGLNRSGVNQQNNRFYPQQLRPATPAAGTTAASRNAFQERLRQITSAVGGGGQGAGEVQILGETKIIADERTNSLLIFANREDMETIKKIVAKMDVVLAQVLIEAIILEVSMGDSQTVSVSAARRDQNGGNDFASLMNNGLGFLNFAGATNISSIGGNAPAGFTWFGQFGEDFAVALNLAAQDNRVKVLSRPSVQTSHAVQASLFVGETRPYITGSYFDSFGGGGSRSQYSQSQIGLQLNVLPLINPEGLVVMDIQQSVQQVAGSVPIDGNDVPITQDQQANAKVAVRDRDTVILGGFIQNNMSKNESGVPFLKNIPLLGNLFKAKNHNNTRRELVVMIRPTVLPTPEDAAGLVKQRQDTTPTLKEAEVDFDIERQRLLDEANQNIMDKRLGLPER